MNGPSARLIFLAALSLATLLACNEGKPCGNPGQRQACTCRGGGSGTQKCLPERVLGECDCAAATRPPDAGRDAASAATDGAVGGKGSGGGGSSVGSAGSGAGGATVDASSTLPQTDDDSGTALSPAMGGTGGVGGLGGAGGMAGSAGIGGAGAAGSMSAAYTACSSVGDCRPSSDCTMVAADALLGTPDYSVCAPPCTTVTDCPVPEGSYEAQVVCDTDQHCHLDCTPVAAADLTCPSGMTCVASQLTTSFCFH